MSEATLEFLIAVSTKLGSGDNGSARAGMEQAQRQLEAQKKAAHEHNAAAGKAQLVVFMLLLDFTTAALLMLIPTDLLNHLAAL